MKNLIIFFKKFLKLIYLSIVNFLFPNYCWNCKKVLTIDNIGFCQSCFDEILLIPRQKHCKRCSSLFFVNFEGYCQSCQQQFHETYYFDKNISCFPYTSAIQDFIKVGKYEKRKSIWRFLAKKMVNVLGENKFSNNLIIIPVPISKKSFSKRGYNQSVLLAKEYSNFFSFQIFLNVLIKVKDNVQQAILNQNQRKLNPLGQYSVKNKGVIEGKSILLVDDVFTTGSTVNECSRVLKENGVKEVIVLTIAKSDFD